MKAYVNESGVDVVELVSCVQDWDGWEQNVSLQVEDIKRLSTYISLNVKKPHRRTPVLPIVHSDRAIPASRSSHLV